MLSNNFGYIVSTIRHALTRALKPASAERKRIFLEKAQTLDTVIRTGGPWDEATQMFLDALEPVLSKAMAGKLTPLVNEDDLPNPYLYRDQGLDDLPDLSKAYAEFTHAGVETDDETLAFIQSLMDQSNKPH